MCLTILKDEWWVWGGVWDMENVLSTLHDCNAHALETVGEDLS